MIARPSDFQDERLSLAQCRDLLGAEVAFATDEQLRAMRDRMYSLADVVLDAVEVQVKK